MPNENPVIHPSRRSFLNLTAAASAAAALGILTEPMFARMAMTKPYPSGAVRIDSNENPLGPCAAAREAAAAIIKDGGRYNDDLTENLERQFAEIEGIRPEYVAAYPGSSNPLYYSVMAFTSGQKSYVTADPGYELGMYAADAAGARVAKVPLTKDYAHDVKAMLEAGPDAGFFYICTPNNPTGTLTSHSDIEYLLEHKPKDAIVMVDEAYIHFSDAPSAIDLVKAGKDVIVLRTFSKIYGMAGMRCGFAIAKPDLLEKLAAQGGQNPMPTTGVMSAVASLKDRQLVPERRRVNATIREQTCRWLKKNGIPYIPSQTNFFMIDTKRHGGDVIAAMANQDVFIGRVWPVMPTWVRITVGTQPEMDRFQAALHGVMNGATTARVVPAKRRPLIDGVSV